LRVRSAEVFWVMFLFEAVGGRQMLFLLGMLSSYFDLWGL
jgi:hypothetical protein